MLPYCTFHKNLNSVTCWKTIALAGRLIKSGELKKLLLLFFYTMSNSFCLGEGEGKARDTVMWQAVVS